MVSAFTWLKKLSCSASAGIVLGNWVHSISAPARSTSPGERAGTLTHAWELAASTHSARHKASSTHSFQQDACSRSWSRRCLHVLPRGIREEVTGAAGAVVAGRRRRAQQRSEANATNDSSLSCCHGVLGGSPTSLRPPARAIASVSGARASRSRSSVGLVASVSPACSEPLPGRNERSAVA
ncbi:hypothetical protein SETIT_1G193100v2 [Setaria italica]|uniref:Uncharacterized protein n=1 Tax=Setaria italica TaxID=4555 RepID=A0A368PM23_SETIT|nr:hypothetical protein SETIT_1G193100v2 [Setaria italica]